MSGIVSGLFGGKTDKTQSSSSQMQLGENWSNQLGLQSSQSGPVNLTTPWFQLLGQQTAGGIGNLITGGPAATTPYSGPFTSPLLGNAQVALDNAQNAALTPAHKALLQQTLSGQFLPGQSGGNPFLAAAIQTAQAPTLAAFEQAVQRRIPGQFAAAGQTLSGPGSSPYMRELGLAAQQGGRALGDIATNLSAQAYNTERDRQQQAMALSQQDVQNMLANVQVQWLPQAIQEQGIDRAIQTGQAGLQNLLSAFQIAQGLPLQNFQQASSSLGLNLGDAYSYNVGRGQSQSTGTSTTSPGIFAGLFGGTGLLPWLSGPNTLIGSA